jgi:hypothetical protein
MWPAPEHFGSRFAARGEAIRGEAASGDYQQAVYHLWLVGHQLDHGRAPWIDPYTFRPESSPRVNFGGWPFGVPFWPLAAAFGVLVAWNLLILLTYLGAGGFTLLWLLELGLPRGAALIGGLAFALAPYRVAQSAGHLRGPISILIPLALWAFERALRGSRWWLVPAGAALASIPFSDLHLALGAVPFFFLYALCRTRSPWLLVGAAACVGAAVGAALLVANQSISGSISSGGRSLREVAVYSATGLDLITRHRRHGPESFIFLGWLAPLLAIAGLVLLVRARRFGLATALGVGAVVPVLLALGTHFPLYSTLWHHFPPLRYPRVPERQLPVACLALAALVAVAVAGITRAARVRAVPHLVTVCYLVAVLLLFADLRLGVSSYRSVPGDSGNAAYAALRSRPPGRLLELPVLHPSVGHGALYLYYDMQAQRERPGGYSTLAPLKAALLALQLEPIDCGVWKPGTEQLLDRLGVRYLAFHSGLYGHGAGWLAWRALTARGWGVLARGGGISTFERGRAETPPPMKEPTMTNVVFCPEWRHRMPRYRQNAFWVRGHGRLVLRLSSVAPVRATFTVDGRTRSRRVTHPTTLTIPLGPRTWHLVNLRVARADRRLKLDQISVR